jgi:hypothetical protein
MPSPAEFKRILAKTWRRVRLVLGEVLEWEAVFGEERGWEFRS